MRTSLIILSLALTCCNSAQAYEFRFNEGTNCQYQGCWAAPSSLNVFRVCLNGTFFFLRREGGVVLKAFPSSGNVEGSLSNSVLTIRVPEGGLKGVYQFRDGLLQSFSAFGRDDPKKTEAVRRRLSRRLPLAERWRSFWVSAARGRDGRNFWRDGGHRLKLWFENPNEAGALMALVALFAFAGVLAMGGCCKVPCLLATALAVFVLVETGSRGGMLAFLLGAGAMVLCEFKWRLPRKALALAVPAFAGAALVLYLLCAQTRIIGQMLALDEGNLIRLHVWTSVPRMMICAPFGWWMPTGHCYCDWFQPVMDFKPLRYLISSHLSILVYGGYVVAFAYAFLWISILRSTFRAAWRNGHALAFGLWLALAAAMFFSPIGLYHYELWVLPGVMLAIHVFRLIRERDLRILSVGWNALASAVLVAGLLLAGLVCERHADDPFLVRRVTGGVKVGHGEVSTWIVNDEQALTGGVVGEFGKELRTYARNHPDMSTVLVVDSLDDLPATVEKLVLTGSSCKDYLSRKRKGFRIPEAVEVYYVSPTVPSAAVRDERCSKGQTRVIIGSVLWNAIQTDLKLPPRPSAIPGAATYIPNWPNHVGL